MHRAAAGTPMRDADIQSRTSSDQPLFRESTFAPSSTMSTDQAGQRMVGGAANASAGVAQSGAHRHHEMYE